MCDMTVVFVPRLTRSQCRLSKAAKKHRLPDFDLALVAKTFATADVLYEVLTECAVFRYRNPRQFSLLDQRLGGQGVERIKWLTLTVKDTEMNLKTDKLFMPPRQFRNRLKHLKSFRVKIEMVKAYCCRLDLTVKELGVVACGRPLSRGWLSVQENAYKHRLVTEGVNSLDHILQNTMASAKLRFKRWLTSFVDPALTETYERVVQFDIRVRPKKDDEPNAGNHWSYQFSEHTRLVCHRCSERLQLLT